MTARPPRLTLFVLAGLVGCAAPDFDGQWVGECDAEVDLRVSVVAQDGEETSLNAAQVTVHSPDHPDTALFLQCSDAVQDGWDVRITGCSGSWEGTNEAHDLVLDGTLDDDGLVPRLLGDCSADGDSGALELLWIP